MTVGRVTLRDGVLEFFDASVTQPPLKVRLEQIQATVRDVVVPGLTGKTRFDLAGVLKSAQRDGAVTIVGWVETATNDSSVNTTRSDPWTWWRCSPTSSRPPIRVFGRAPSTST